MLPSDDFLIKNTSQSRFCTTLSPGQVCLWVCNVTCLEPLTPAVLITKNGSNTWKYNVRVWINSKKVLLSYNVFKSGSFLRSSFIIIQRYCCCYCIVSLYSVTHEMYFHNISTCYFGERQTSGTQPTLA